jgi:hypothetical protein
MIQGVRRVSPHRGRRGDPGRDDLDPNPMGRRDGQDTIFGREAPPVQEPERLIDLVDCEA